MKARRWFRTVSLTATLALSIAALAGSQACAISKIFRPSYVTVGLQDARDLRLATKGETVVVDWAGSFWTDAEYQNVIQAAEQERPRTFPIEGLDFIRLRAGQAFCPPDNGLIASDTHNEVILGVRFKPLGEFLTISRH